MNKKTKSKTNATLSLAKVSKTGDMSLAVVGV